jgi:TonB family protein
MKKVALAAVFASFALAAPALADEYDDAVAAQVGKYLTYPKAAAKQDVEGTVGVKVDIDNQGHVINVALEAPSHVRELDLATLTAVRRIAPTMQAAVGEAYTLHLHVNYKLI